MPIRPTPASLLTQPRPNQPNNAPKTDKIIPKDAKNDHPDRTISRKTLDFRPIQPAEKIFPEKRSTNPLPPQRGGRCPAGTEGGLPSSQTWIQLNQTEQS